MTFHAAISLALATFWVGGFLVYVMERNSRQQLRDDLQTAYAEADELRSILYSGNGSAIRHAHTPMCDCA